MNNVFQMVRVFFYKTRDDAHLPELDYAGFELKAPGHSMLCGDGFDTVDVGLAVWIPEGCYGIIMNKVDPTKRVNMLYCSQEYNYTNDFFVVQNFVPPNQKILLKLRIFKHCPDRNTYPAPEGRDGYAPNIPINIAHETLAVLRIKKIRKRNIERVIKPEEWLHCQPTLPFSS